MSNKRRTFTRPLGERRYKKLFVVSVEGSKTEPQYFAIFNEPESIILVKCLRRKSTNSSPNHVLKRMEGYLQKEGLRKTDEAWLVVDKDNWTEDQLRKLLEWEKNNTNHGLALSNPHFEYWLLLHFEDGKGMTNAHECLGRLEKYLCDYEKNIDAKKFTLERINQAITRAKQRDVHRSSNLPQIWSTGVYRLVEKILNHK